MEYTVVVEKRHCEGRKYQSNTDCPLCAAIREQIPNFKLKSVGGIGLHDSDGGRWLLVVSNYGSADAWVSTKVQDLMNGKIKSVRVTFKNELLSKEPDAQASVATKPIVVPSAWPNKQSSLTNLIPIVEEVSDTPEILVNQISQ